MGRTLEGTRDFCADIHGQPPVIAHAGDGTGGWEGGDEP